MCGCCTRRPAYTQRTRIRTRIRTRPRARARTPLQDATLNAAAGKYAGMDRFEARAALWADLEAQGLAIKKEPYTIR